MTEMAGRGATVEALELLYRADLPLSSNANTVSFSTANANGFIGIAAGDGASFNTFDSNTALNNAVFDAGQQPSTTGNVWTNTTVGTTFGI